MICVQSTVTLERFCNTVLSQNWSIDLISLFALNLLYIYTAVIYLKSFLIIAWDLSFVSHRLEFTIGLNQHCKIYFKIWDLSLLYIDLVIYAVYALDLKSFALKIKRWLLFSIYPNILTWYQSYGRVEAQEEALSSRRSFSRVLVFADQEMISAMARIDRRK